MNVGAGREVVLRENRWQDGANPVLGRRTFGSMTTKQRPKTGRKAGNRSPVSAKRRTRRSTNKGVDMSDLVGTIKITVDPMEYQRSIRNEW